MRRLHERGEAQARSARPRVLAAADRELLRWFRGRLEAARAAIGNCPVPPVAGVRLHQ